jgi:hypothetical protein
MKMDLCDVCWRRDGKLTPADRRKSIPPAGKKLLPLAVDLCHAHQNSIDGKSLDEVMNYLFHEEV